jgi:hypothetical protein
MRKSNLFVIYLLLNITLLGLVGFQVINRQKTDMVFLKVKTSLVRQLDLTDLCLFTEARYTRHPSQADLHTPFQDSPLTFEHFPSGSLLGPPLRFRK